jgi:hypothetical protein
MRRTFIGALIASVFIVGSGGVAWATPTGTITHPGQHNQDCGVLLSPPGGGNSSNSPGSPFAGGNSASNYAGQKPQNSRNGQNSQYDVACFQQSAH